MTGSTEASPPAGGGATDKLDRSTLLVAAVVILGALMSILDATVVNVALVTLQRDLDTSLPTIQWVVSAYTLALASVIPLSGWLSDRFGARRVWLGAVAVFVIGSVACAFSSSALWLILARVLQGFGGGILTPVGTTLIATSAGPSRMGRVMSLMGVPLLLGPVLGPVLGGALLQYVGWEWIFLINVPIGAVALLMGWRLLPHSSGATSSRLDLIGLLLLSPALAAIIFGISEIRTVADLGSAAVLIPLAASLVLLVAFVVRSLRISAPLLDLRLFQGRTFSAAAVTTFALGAATFGAVFLVPLYFQQVRDTSVLVTGLLTTPQAVGMAVSMSLAGRWADKIGAGWVAPTGLVLSIGALLGFTTVNGTTSFWVIAAYLVLMGLGLGASMMPAMSAAYASLANAAAISRATAELQIVQRVGSALGVALFAVILQQRVTAVSPPGAPPTKDQLATAFSGTFWWGVGLSALALIPALLLPRKDLGVRAAIQAHSQPLAGNAPLAERQKV